MISNLSDKITKYVYHVPVFLVDISTKLCDVGTSEVFEGYSFFHFLRRGSRIGRFKRRAFVEKFVVKLWVETLNSILSF